MSSWLAKPISGRCHVTFHVQHPTFGIGQWQARNLGLGNSSYDPQLLAPLFGKLLALDEAKPPRTKKSQHPILPTYQPIRPDKMASMITRRFFSTTVRRLQTTTKQELQAESKRNPETYVRHN